VNNQMEIDLELGTVSDGALAMLERVSGATNLPTGLFSRLLDALADEHLRRLGAQVSVAATLRVPLRVLDPDELWHSMRLLGNWLGYMDEASRDDPDLEATTEVIARVWLGMYRVLSPAVEESLNGTGCESNN
jgi:hypothetical protein